MHSRSSLPQRGELSDLSIYGILPKCEPVDDLILSNLGHCRYIHRARSWPDVAYRLLLATGNLQNLLDP